MTRPPLWLAFCPAYGCGSGISISGSLDAAECPKCGRRAPYLGAERFGADEWNGEDRPDYLFGCLTALGRGPSVRQRRLLHVAVARVGFGWVADELYRAAIDTAEWNADADIDRPVVELVHALGGDNSRLGSDTADARAVVLAGLHGFATAASGSRESTRALYADAYRELFPNPFVPLAWDPDWFTPTARDLARHIYDNHDFGAMPILADALQDAGCDDEQVLAHCRSDKPHARGCWVLDAILGL